MQYVRRGLERQLIRAVKNFPAVVLTGPRRAGKTYLLRRLFPRASYFLLEDPDVVARLRADPQGFLDGVKTPAILDEVQNVPEVFALVKPRPTPVDGVKSTIFATSRGLRSISWCRGKVARLHWSSARLRERSRQQWRCRCSVWLRR